MPKANMSLYEQATNLTAKATELLKLKAAVNSMLGVDQYQAELATSERDLKNTVKAIAGYEYDIKKLDKAHPNYAEKLASLQSSIASLMVSRDDYTRRVEAKKITLKSEQERAKKQIAKIESGEYLLSSMDKQSMSRELLNKMTYGIGA